MLRRASLSLSSKRYRANLPKRSAIHARLAEIRAKRLSIYTSERLSELFTIHAGVAPVSLLRFHFEVMVAVARRYGGKNYAVQNVAHSAAEGLECHGMRYMFA